MFATSNGFGTKYKFTQIRNGVIIDEWTADNIVPNEGLNHALSVVYDAGTQVTSWYVGLFSNNHTPVAGDTGASIDGSTIVEITAYTGNRPLINFAVPSGQTVSNSANTADFTFTGAATLRGGFVCSASVKGTVGGGNGTLISVVNIGADRAIQNGDIVKATVTVAASSV